jgi:hypothetical protein
VKNSQFFTEWELGRNTRPITQKKSRCAFSGSLFFLDDDDEDNVAPVENGRTKTKLSDFFDCCVSARLLVNIFFLSHSC